MTPFSAGSKIIDFSFYLYRVRSAEDARKIPAEVMDLRAHRATGLHIWATGHRRRSAEDTAEVIQFGAAGSTSSHGRGLSSNAVDSRWLHWVVGHMVATG